MTCFFSGTGESIHSFPRILFLTIGLADLARIGH